MSPTSAEEHGNISPTSSSPPRPGFQHGGKRIRNSDRSVYETTNFSRQPHPTILKRITWQDVLGGPYLSLPEAERRRVANQIRAVARNLAQLLIINNSTPPTYTDMETCTVAEPPWVPDFFESERDWRPSIPKVQHEGFKLHPWSPPCRIPENIYARLKAPVMSRYLASRFPDILTSVKDGRSGTTQTLLPWVPQLILQNAYQRYARGVRLFYSREVASQETYSFGDIIVGALKSFSASNTATYGSAANTLDTIAGSASVVEEPPGLTQAKLHEMLSMHPPKQELRLKRTLALKREESEGMSLDIGQASSPKHHEWDSDNGTHMLVDGHCSPRSSFSSSWTYVKEETEPGMGPEMKLSYDGSHGALWPEDPEA